MTGGSGEPDGGVRATFAELAGVGAGVDTEDEDEAGNPAGTTSTAEKTLQPLLLHSLADLREVWLPLLDAAQVHSITEVGSESGATTTLLVEVLRRGGGGRLLVIDPDPGVVPTSGGGLDVDVIRGYSPEALDGHTPTDAYLLDGDHNYHTVSAELAAIQGACGVFGLSSFPLVVLHDVGWPAGRRDQYYNPDRIPAHARQPYSWDVGVRVDHIDAASGGFRGEGAFAWALAEGGPRNGVRTAAEDFVAAHPWLRLFTVTAVFGLGVIVDTRAPWARRVTELIEPWASNTLLARMERNRIDLYLRVLQLQDDLVAAARARQREWARLDGEHSRIAELELQRLSRIADLEQALAAQQREAEQARAALADEPKLVHAARVANAALKERLERTAAGKTALPALRRLPLGAPGTSGASSGVSGAPTFPVAAGSIATAGSSPPETPGLPEAPGSGPALPAGSSGLAAGSGPALSAGSEPAPGHRPAAPGSGSPAGRPLSATLSSSVARWLPARTRRFSRR